MDAKSLKKLNRRELLELMVKISEENETLTRENEVLKGELENRSISAREVGSLAHASLEANNYFAAAENAAKLYLENILRIERDTKHRSSALLEETLAECINLRAAAGFGPEDLVPESWGALGNIETELAQDAAAEVPPVPEPNSVAEELQVSEAAPPAQEEAAPKKKKKLFGRKAQASA